ncbi:cyclase family protein [Paenibacillus sedimenti]|uniref:Cyclase family protein n=1 Tax=Paenibacillus sedimenti TaxID=2770274 RepID=A0A926KKM7_9BACL|nr:cyclase family protein [Paenibacillus sedimenti]MBD0378858.1 cyclase family protein [Paenibacillus sedimenti]
MEPGGIDRLADLGLDRITILNELIRSSKIVDLSVLLEKGIPKWASHPSLVIDPTATHEHDGYACQSIFLGEHTGTHVDAPFHIHSDLSNCTIEHMDPGSLIGKCTVIDLSRKGWKPGERASLADITAALEETHFEVEEGDIVLIHFGWMRYWTTSNAWSYYANNQPGFTEDVADYFIHKKVKAVGTDTAAVGTPVVNGTIAGPCYFHEKLLRKGIYLMECLNQLEQLPPKCFFMAAPLKISRGTGSPIRALAVIP